ncbi:MAG: polyprenyl diphosphate synthase [Spirochaetes bacterium]|jgi:undecaprenyl diphosphate synthase|nr:polyprenyl diphosphate synthase [Spirochaetota bacterium]
MKNYKTLINPKNVINHVAIIMDGNGRWAEKRSLSRMEGHRKGALTIDPVIEAAHSIRIKALSLYAFSTENWSRPKDEIAGLWETLEWFYNEKRAKFMKNGVKIRFSGSTEKLPDKTINTIKKFTGETKNNKNIVINICLNYGGRSEIINSVNKWLPARKAGEKINEKILGKNLYTAGLPDVDMMIRTGGEYRISNFLLWQLAYSELIFMDVLWPDFTPNHLFKAVYEFQKRDRRFGGL